MRENNVAILDKLLIGTRERLRVSQATMTDVAQAQARRAAAVSIMRLSQANFQTSQSDFARIIGYQPGHLQMPSANMATLPGSLNEAIAIGETENPAVIAAQFRHSNARFSSREVEGQLLPEVNVVARYDHRYNSTRLIDDSESASVVGRVTVPLYQAGDVQAQIRQARQNETATVQDTVQARLLARANVIAAWTRLAATRAQIISDRVRVQSSQTALDGVKQEEQVGQRTILDVLNAEQELLDARIQQVSTTRDRIVAEFSLLAALGRLDTQTLQLPTEAYDPQQHLDEVEHQAWGITVTTEEDFRD